MAVRPIDANAMLNELRPVSFEAEHSVVLLSDVSKIMRKWVERQPTLTPPNEPLTCDGCDMQGKEVTPCASCIRDPRVCDYYTRRPPERQERET